MAENEPVSYVKLSSTGDVIERTALTPTDHVQLRGTGWVEKESDDGRRVTNPKKGDTVEGISATSVTAHAAAAQTGDPSSSDSATGSKAVGSKPASSSGPHPKS
jgi:hypothetical protein